MEEDMKIYIEERVLQVIQTFEKMLIEYQIVDKLLLERETKNK